jgi:hypothetical protein
MLSLEANPLCPLLVRDEIVGGSSARPRVRDGWADHSPAFAWQATTLHRVYRRQTPRTGGYSGCKPGPEIGTFRLAAGMTPTSLAFARNVEP